MDDVNLVMLAVLAGIFLVAFAALAATSPSEDTHCPDGKLHDWGPWELQVRGGENWHRCKLCGYQAREGLR